MIYITGDCHSDFHRFSRTIFPEQREMTKSDYVIICGDFGGVWDYHGENEREKNLLDWLEQKPYNKAIEDAQKNQTGVTLSTMHCSKGLEWKHVFIIDCVEGITPFEKAQTIAAVEEERRLFYVAMTRAKEHLYLCTYSERAKKQVKRSRFLA